MLVWRPFRAPPALMDSQLRLSDEEIARQFHLLWYERRQEQTWKRNTWFGAVAQQCPFDLGIFQEIIAETRPEAVVELGVKHGGTALYFAHLLDLLYAGDSDAGILVGVDIHLAGVAKATRQHSRVRLIEGSSTDPGVVGQVRELCRSRRTMVMADSDHSFEHVRAELAAYADLVSPGGYLVVSDTNINGHPAAEAWGPGPFEAVEDFLSENHEFSVDEDRERHMMTLNPRGFLRKRKRLERLQRR
jgi:cephalosporin hydroxylase